MLRRLAPLLLVIAACSGDPFYELPPLDPAPEALAAVLVDASGRIVQGSRVQPSSRAVELELVDGQNLDEVALFVVGIDLTAHGAELPSDGAESLPVRAAVGCEPRLFVSSAARLDDGPVEVSAPPPLTVPWLAMQCPLMYPPDGGGFIEVCQQSYCGEVVQQGCRIRVPRAPCFDFGDDDLVGTIYPDGRVCLEEPSCTTVDGSSPAQVTCELADAPCPVTFHGVASLEDRIQVEGIEVYPNAREPPGITINDPGPADFLGGYLSDFVVRDGRVVVVGFGGRSAQFEHLLMEDLEFRFFDAETLVETSSRAAPRGVSSLVLDPFGAGFVSARYRGSLGWSAARFNLDGALLEEVPFELPDGPALELHEILYRSETEEFVVVTGQGGVPRHHIITLDARTLAARSICTHRTTAGATRFYIVDAALSGRSRVLLSNNEDDFVHWVNTDTCINEETTFFGTGRIGMGYLAKTPGGGVYIGLAGDAPYSAIYRLSVGQNVEPGSGAFFFESLGGPAALHALSNEELLVGLYTQRSPETKADGRLAIYDVAREQVLPGSVSAGFGPPHRFQEDEQGRVWTIQPWGARLSRITVSPPR